MPTESAKLMIECQMALQITQKQLAALVGKDRRTIQRWQDRGCPALLASDAEPLVRALRPVRPDLADRVLAMAVPESGVNPVTPVVLDAILAAAARAGGTTRQSVTPLVRAAFREAARQGVEVSAVAAFLE